MSNSVYIGLSVLNALSEIEDKETALRNLGLDIDDLERIQNLNEVINTDELRLAANLDYDQKAELWGLFQSATAIESEIQKISGIQLPLNYNYNINNQLQAEAIKFNFFDRGDKETKLADVSTSRASSWSSAEEEISDTSPIFYGGNLNVKGNLKASKITVLSNPVPKKYNAEVATHLVTINIDGVEKQCFAMRGIPLLYQAFFRNATLKHKVVPEENVNPVWEISNNNSEVFVKDVNEPTDEITFLDFVNRERTVLFYYNPSKILELELPSIFLSSLSTTIMNNLELYDLSLNDLSEMPNFVQLTPNLQTLNIAENDLSRSDVSPNLQVSLNYLPESLVSLDISACFEGSPGEEKEFLDLSHLTSLEIFRCNDSYLRRIRELTDSPFSPAVNSNTIREYSINGQSAFSELHSSVQSALNLEVLSIVGCGIEGDLDLQTNKLVEFNSQNNGHSVLDVNQISTLTTYIHRRSNFNNVEPLGQNINGIFTGCESLQSIDFFQTPVTGSITSNFQNLPSLQILDLQRTALSGNITDTTFEGTEQLRELYISQGQYSSAVDFFSIDSLKILTQLNKLVVESNTNITGPLPSFVENTNLREITIANTGINGLIPSFQNNTSLSDITLRDNSLTGSVPLLSGSQFKNVNFSNNLLDGNFIKPEAPFLETLDVSFNSLIGIIPSFNQSEQIQSIDLQSNQFDSYTPGALSNCTLLSAFLANNNFLRLQDGLNILSDLALSYRRNPRSRVEINLLGNEGITRTQIESNANGNANLQILENAGWTILINP